MITIKLTEKELEEIKEMVDTVSSLMCDDETTVCQVDIFDRVLKRNKIDEREFK